MSASSEEERDSFDAEAYLKDFYAGKIDRYTRVPLFVKFTSQFSDGSIEMLDVGGGPCIIPLIITARKVTRYIHADYAQNNRTAVERWWKKDPTGFDWRENVRYVLKLEGSSGTDEEVREREELMRRVLCDVVHCDVLSDHVIPPGFGGPYDVVSCISCLDCVCSSLQSLSAAIDRLSRLVKGGGYLMLESSTVCENHSSSDAERKRMDEKVGEVIRQEAGYYAGDKDIGGFKYKGFFYEHISTYVKMMESCGFTVVEQMEYIYDDPSINYTDHVGVLIGQKMYTSA